MTYKSPIRLAFEKWVSSPPYEYDISRFSDDSTKTCWPENYKMIQVQLAWEAWCEAYDRYRPANELSRIKRLTGEIEALKSSIDKPAT